MKFSVIFSSTIIVEMTKKEKQKGVAKNPFAVLVKAPKLKHNCCLASKI
tara:strand:+ start:143 stop:289 length:147 start_codon:yes stop_codon:yes gene_type:complete